jgi:sulfide dehydrogenase [flavocytochrome c] flavoprotein subunit
MNRRQFVQIAGATALLPLVGSMYGCATRPGSGRVVVIGGGFGGTTAAKYLKKYNPALEVTLVEPNKTHVTCPGSNWYLGDMLDSLDSITHTYDALKKYGVNVIHDAVVDVDTDKHSVVLSGGMKLDYDKLVVSPGIDFKWGVIEGVTADNASKIPHAWKAGEQTVTLKQQMKAMKKGGTFVMIAPPNPYRCPPGPYERVGMVGQFFKKHNPTAKILVLDPKDKFSKQGLFVQAWQELYGDMIEWVSSTDGGKVSKVDVSTMTVYAESGDVKADVINAIPPQKAGELAFKLGLTNESGFCPVNPHNFESTLKKDVHVIGDASIAGAMPKSGHAASTQAKICAASIVNAFVGTDAADPTYVNTCYSLISDKYGISIAGVYAVQNGKLEEIKGSGGVSPKDADASFRELEATYTKGWYNSVTRDIWG